MLPTAFVKHLDVDRGFSAAANEALTSVEGAAFYLFLHDDVRLGPDAVTSLVAEAFRANGGIVGPKLVEWDDPGVLQSVGYSVDPYGFSFSISEPGELDQSQHDTSREVFAVSDACLLIRADLFETIGGFSDGIPYFGEDIDLCWRVHTAAATVHLYPPVVVRHRARFDERRVAEKQERLELRHEARTMLSNYELPRLLRVVPVVALLSLMDLLGSMVLGRFSRAGDIVASWLWNLWNLPSLFGARARVRRTRRAKDADYLPLMRQGSSRLSGLVRSDEGENRLQAAANAAAGTSRTSRPGRAGTAPGSPSSQRCSWCSVPETCSPDRSRRSVSSSTPARVPRRCSRSGGRAGASRGWAKRRSLREWSPVSERSAPSCSDPSVWLVASWCWRRCSSGRSGPGSCWCRPARSVPGPGCSRPTA